MFFPLLFTYSSWLAIIKHSHFLLATYLHIAPASCHRPNNGAQRSRTASKVMNDVDDILEDLQAPINILQLEELASLRHHTTNLHSEQHLRSNLHQPHLKFKLNSNLREPHAQNTHLLTQQNSRGLASNSGRGLQQSEQNLPLMAKLSVVTWLNSTISTSILWQYSSGCFLTVRIR